MGHNHSHHGHMSSDNHLEPASVPPPPTHIIDLASQLVILSHTNNEHIAADCILKNVFSDAFVHKNPTIGRVLFDHFCRNCLCPEPECLTAQDFVRRCEEIVDLVTETDQVDYYLRVFSVDGKHIDGDALRSLVLQAFEMAMWAHPDTVNLSIRVDNILSAVADSCLHGRDRVSLTFARNWMLQHCPRLLKWLHRWLVHRVTTAAGELAARGAGDAEGEPPPTSSCVLDSASASSVASIHPALLWMLMCSLPELYTKPKSVHSLPSLLGLATLDPDQFIGRMVESMTPKHWVSLYSSDDQGLSANRFQHLVLTYTGPTITLVRAEQDHLFCVAADVGWKDSPHYWGKTDCMALQLLPKFQVLCHNQPDTVYYNMSARGMAPGLRVGEDRRTPTLSVDREMRACEYRGIPLRLHSVEVWGCGNPQQRDRQITSQKREFHRAEQRRQVDLMADSNWNENPDKYLLELSGARQSYNYS